ncbi:hypothetical protein ANN_19330 [Periplaneta americana]|uniref:Uncharacterized protein n=1 Tax=Periplaneta americana TaxID=6978 RepID=A0ABQ8S9J9_PERAM|nr:hypothetical protein ANN_19330 [Periplaneta americana]
MSPEFSNESYPAFARIGLRENPGKNLNQLLTSIKIQNLYQINTVLESIGNLSDNDETLAENSSTRRVLKVLKMLTEEHKTKRASSALSFLTRYSEQGDEFLDHIVTGKAENKVKTVMPKSPSKMSAAMKKLVNDEIQVAYWSHDRRQIAAECHIGLATVNSITKRYRETGSITPQKKETMAGKGRLHLQMIV